MFIPITIMEIYDHEFLLVGIFHTKLFFSWIIAFQGGLSKILIGTIRKNPSHSVVRSEGKHAVLGCLYCYYPEICSGNNHIKNIQKLPGQLFFHNYLERHSSLKLLEPIHCLPLQHWEQISDDVLKSTVCIEMTNAYRPQQSSHILKCIFDFLQFNNFTCKFCFCDRKCSSNSIRKYSTYDRHLCLVKEPSWSQPLTQNLSLDLYQKIPSVFRKFSTTFM